MAGTLTQSLFALGGRDLFTGATTEVHPGKRGLVAVFLSTQCPCSNSHMAEIKAVAKDFKKDFNFVAVQSNEDESLKESKDYFERMTLGVPVLRDSGAQLANQLHAARTPHAFVLAADGKTVLYKGGVTDSADAGSATRHFLRAALTDISSDRKVQMSESRPLGCAISR